jgi:hypothetical protein
MPLGASSLAHSQCSSASMSSSRLFLGRLLSSRACLRFADRERFSKTKPRRTMIFQRPATTPLTPCLITRVHSTNAVPCSRPHPRLVMNAANFNLMARVSFKSVSACGFTPGPLAASTTTQSTTQMSRLRAHDPSKLLGDVVDLVGIEPTTSSMPWKRAPSCATGPRENTAALQRCTRGGATQFSPTGW